MTIALDGVTAVLVTPYSGGTDRVDEAAVTAIAAHAAAAGIPVLTALGNTAEVQQLTDEERRTVLRGVAAVDHPVTRIAGVCGGLRTVLAEIETAAGLGYQAAMVHEPADPFGDGDGLTRYYQQLAASAPLPIVLYLRSTRLTAAHLAELVALPGVVGVKYARPDLHSLAGLLAGPAREQCTWINGLAESAVAAFGALGIPSFTSGIANAVPEVALAVHRAVTAGDLATIQQLQADVVGPVEALRAEHGSRYNVATIKELLRWQGIEAGGVRPPHSELAGVARTRLAALRPALTSLGSQV